MSVREWVGLSARILGVVLVFATGTGLAHAQCCHGGGGGAHFGSPGMGGSADPRMLQALVAQNMMQQQLVMQQVQQQMLQKKQLDDLTRELTGKGPDDIKKALRDPRVEMRWLASLVVGEKGLPLSRELMELLTDDNAHVRQAARRSLVSLSKIAQKNSGELKKTVRNPRGVDFGPLAEGNRAAQKIAVRKWGEWFDKHSSQLEADVVKAPAAR